MFRFQHSGYFDMLCRGNVVTRKGQKRNIVKTKKDK